MEYQEYALVCPKTKTFQCHGTIAEESKISIAQHGINFTFGPSLSVSRDHLVVQVHVVSQVHFERTHPNKSLHVITQKWNIEKITFGSFEANSSFNLVTKSSVNCEPFFPGSNILVNVQMPSYSLQSLESPRTQSFDRAG